MDFKCQIDRDNKYFNYETVYKCRLKNGKWDIFNKIEKDPQKI